MNVEQKNKEYRMMKFLNFGIHNSLFYIHYSSDFPNK